MRKAYDAGVPLLTGSEAGFSMVPYGDWHYRELEVFVRHFGLTPLQAIQCATQQSAFGLKMLGETGVVAPGYKADLIIVDGDPSKDVTVLGKPGAIRHVDGWWCAERLVAPTAPQTHSRLAGRQHWPSTHPRHRLWAETRRTVPSTLRNYTNG